MLGCRTSVFHCSSIDSACSSTYAEIAFRWSAWLMHDPPGSRSDLSASVCHASKNLVGLRYHDRADQCTKMMYHPQDGARWQFLRSTGRQSMQRGSALRMRVPSG